MKRNVVIQNMARTRLGREYRHAKPVSGRYFAIMRVGRFDVMDVVCRDCRERVGARAWDVQHDNEGNEPDDFK